MSNKSESAIRVFLKYFKSSLIYGITKVQGDYKFVIRTSSTNYYKIKRIVTQINNDGLIKICIKYIKLTSLDNKNSTERLFEVTILAHNGIFKSNPAYVSFNDIFHEMSDPHMSKTFDIETSIGILELFIVNHNLMPHEGVLYNAINSNFNDFYRATIVVLNRCDNIQLRSLIVDILHSIITNGFYYKESLYIDGQIRAVLLATVILNTLGLTLRLTAGGGIILRQDSFITPVNSDDLNTPTGKLNYELTSGYPTGNPELLLSYLNKIDLTKIKEDLSNG